jgi:probable phosphomutase (TIGR03848 family)
MTTFLLIRHADNASVGKFIAGRKAGVHLTQTGQAQAERLAGRLSSLNIAAIYSSPMERARETIEPLAQRLGLEVRVLEGLNELNYGEWTGKSSEEMANLAEWKEFNIHRSRTRIPGGEMLLEAQARAVAALEQLAGQHPEEIIAVVSHADVLRAVLAYYLGIPLDLSLRVEIGLASVSLLALNAGEARLLLLNDTGSLSTL